MIKVTISYCNNCIEELEVKAENKNGKYLCLVRFYDGETYVERLMWVDEDGDVFTEEIVLEVEYTNSSN